MLAVGVAVGALSRGVLDRGASDERMRGERHVADLQEQVRTLRESESTLRTDLQRREAPEPNVLVTEVLSDGSAARLASHARGAPATRLALSGERTVVLVLTVEDDGGPAVIELRDARGQVVWTGRDLRPNGQGQYTLGLPTALLADGRQTIVLRPSRGPAETYTVVVQREAVSKAP
jgi:hypothetical protein